MRYFLCFAMLLGMIFISGCEITKGMQSQYRCSKCGAEVLMLSGCARTKEYCSEGGKHEWRHILNR